MYQGHYVTVADFNPKTKKISGLRFSSDQEQTNQLFGNWFKRERLERGGLTSSAYYIYGVHVGRHGNMESAKGIQFQKDLFTFYDLHALKCKKKKITKR